MFLARLVIGITLLVIVFALRTLPVPEPTALVRGRPESVEPRTLPLPAPRRSAGATAGPSRPAASAEKRRAEQEKSLRQETEEPTLPIAELHGNDSLGHPSESRSDSLGTPVLVRQVIDGDTILLDDGQVVRYIGIDAPETGKRGAPECFARESTARNRTLVEGKHVRLKKDISERDAYGRTLRYVYVEDAFVNEVLIREGVARAFAFPPDVAFSVRFRSAERDAREAKRGLWSGACAEPNASDDRDCGDFRSRADAQSFFLAQGGPARDPHRLDQDGDGVACESL